jgi:hypothetical protein
MKTINEIMDDLGDQQLLQFYNQISLLTDNLGKDLIAKIGGPNSPLSVDQLPWKRYSKLTTLNRLHALEEMGIFKSEMQRKGTGYVRTFNSTDLAKRLAKNIVVED